MPKKSKRRQFSDTERATIARHFRRAFGGAPFLQRYSDGRKFQQRYSDLPMAALLVNSHNAKSRHRCATHATGPS